MKPVRHYTMVAALLLVGALLPSIAWGQGLSRPASSKPVSEQCRLMPVPDSLTAPGQPGDFATDGTDFYVYTGTGRAPHTWILVGGGDGGHSLTFGTDEPSGGSDGDSYIKTDSGYVYSKESGIWSQKVQFQIAGSGATIGTNPQTDNYTLVFGDSQQIVALNAATAKTITVPANASVAYDVGTRVWVRQDGAGAVSIAAAGGVTITQRSGTLVIGATGHYASLLKTATNAWELSVDRLDNSTTTDPTTGDDAADGYQVGSVWRNSTSGALFYCASNTTSSAVWTKTAGYTATELSAPRLVALSSSSTDTFVGTATPALSSYTTGTHVTFVANTANTGAASINVNSLGAKTIVKVAGGVTTTLANNDILVNQVVDLVYDGTNFQIQSTLGNAAAGGGTPAGSDTYVQYNDSSAFGGNAGLTINKTTGALTHTRTTLAANTLGTGYLLTNTTAATSGNQSYSPAIQLTGQGWKTTATAASQAVDWYIFNQPVQGAANPTTNLLFQSQVNGGTITTRATLSDSGTFNAAAFTAASGSFVANSGGFTASASSIFAFSTRSRIKSTVDGSISFRNNADTSNASITGTTTNDDAVAGGIGEFVESAILGGSAVSLSTGSTGNVTSISLTAGDWDVQGMVTISWTGATVTGAYGGFYTNGTGVANDAIAYSGITGTGVTGGTTLSITRRRYSLSGTTSVYLNANCQFSAGTASAYGTINARRVR